MWETVIVILTVLIAATGVGYGLYRSASGNAGCSACHGCGKLSSRGPENSAVLMCDAETK